VAFPPARTVCVLPSILRTAQPRAYRARQDGLVECQCKEFSQTGCSERDFQMRHGRGSDPLSETALPPPSLTGSCSPSTPSIPLAMRFALLAALSLLGPGLVQGQSRTL
jgi:hypothetical protein